MKTTALQKSIPSLAALVLGLLATLLSPLSLADQPLAIGYLEQRAAPLHFSRSKQVYDNSVPDGVSWRSFPGNAQLLQALQDGSISVAYGLSPEAFARGIAQDIEMHAVGIALVQIGDSLELVVASDAVVNGEASQLQAFMDVTEATNTQWRATPDTMRPAIAAALDLPQGQSDLALDASRYPLALEQRDGNWMETRAIEQIEQQAELLIDAGLIEGKPDNYAVFITLRFLR